MSIIESAYRAFCKERFPLPTEAQVAAFEALIGTPLPSDYRQFLLQYNGGLFTQPKIIPRDEDCPPYAQSGLDFLLGIGAPDSVFALERWAYTFDDFPVQMLPIGYTPLGHLLFVITDREGDDYGVIGIKKAFSEDAFELGSGIEEFFRLLYP